ncbi:MAG: TonB-dependent receptor [Fusobacterium sp. JB021]|nr:TonB-dependent receptor [Fusobacterium sp. JB020]MDP0492751.1 TonB-dependent receptor [Fusobacterium sp. JB021]
MKKGLLLFYLALSALALADDVTLGKSVISPDYIEVEKLKSTKNVIVIDEKDIAEKGYQNVSEILDDVPGITVGTSGWGEIDIRGQGEGQAAKNVQVLVDGAPITLLLNHPYTANYDIVPVEQIEKVEIIPGGGSVLYGNGTVGGVINITTNLKSMAKPKNKVGYEFTIDQEKRYYANIGEKINDNLTIQLNYSKSEKDWFFVDTFDNTEYFSGGFNYKISDKQGVALKYSRFEENGKFLKQVNNRYLKKYGREYRPNPSSVTVGVDENKQKIKKTISGYNIADRLEENWKGTYSLDINDNLNLSVDGFHNEGHFKNNPYEHENDQKIDQKTDGIKAKLNYKYAKKNSVLFGLDYFKQNASINYDDVTMRSTKKGDIPEPGETVTSSGYIKNTEGKYTYKADQLNFDYERYVKALYFLNIFKYKDLEFTQGVRFDRTDWKTYKKAAGGWGVVDGTSHRDNWNYELSAGYNYRDTGKVYARYERGFTGPDGMQITDRVYIDDKKATVLTKAEDEIFDIYEIGLRDYVLGSAFNLTLFYNETDNQMDRFYHRDNGHLNMITANLYKTHRYGLETSLSQNIGKFSFEESYTYLMGKSDYNDKGKALKGEVSLVNSGLKKVPKHNIMLSSNYNFTDNFSAGLTWKYTGSYNNFSKETDNEDGVVKSNTVVDLSLKYNHPNGISVYGGINNLFNEDYFGYVSGSGSYTYVVPQQGRSFFAGFSYTF